MVRVLRKGERRELQRVHHRQAEEREAGAELGEDREIVPADVVAENERSAVRELVQLADELSEGERSLDNDARARVGAKRRELVNNRRPGVRRLDVDANAARLPSGEPRRLVRQARNARGGRGHKLEGSGGARLKTCIQVLEPLQQTPTACR